MSHRAPQTQFPPSPRGNRPSGQVSKAEQKRFSQGRDKARKRARGYKTWKQTSSISLPKEIDLENKYDAEEEETSEEDDSTPYPDSMAPLGLLVTDTAVEIEKKRQENVNREWQREQFRKEFTNKIRARTTETGDRLSVRFADTAPMDKSSFDQILHKPIVVKEESDVEGYDSEEKLIPLAKSKLTSISNAKNRVLQPTKWVVLSKGDDELLEFTHRNPWLSQYVPTLRIRKFFRVPLNVLHESLSWWANKKITEAQFLVSTIKVEELCRELSLSSSELRVIRESLPAYLLLEKDRLDRLGKEDSHMSVCVSLLFVFLCTVFTSVAYSTIYNLYYSPIPHNSWFDVFSVQDSLVEYFVGVDKYEWGFGSYQFTIDKFQPKVTPNPIRDLCILIFSCLLSLLLWSIYMFVTRILISHKQRGFDVLPEHQLLPTTTVSDIPQKPQNPDTKLEYKGTTRKVNYDEDRNSLIVTGIANKSYRPIVHSSNIVNELEAIKARALNDVPMGNPVAIDNFLNWCRANEADMYGVGIKIEPLDFDVWLAGVNSSASVKRVLQREWDTYTSEGRTIHSKLSSMELSRATVRSSFVKQETLLHVTPKGQLKKAPRLVQGAPPIMIILTGMWMTPFQGYLKNRLGAKNKGVCLGFSDTGLAVGNRIGARNYEHEADNDFSHMDVSIQRAYAEYEVEFCYRFGAPPVVLDLMTRNIRTRGYSKGGWYYEVDGTRKSGDTFTTILNSTWTINTSSYICSRGRPFIDSSDTFSVTATGDDSILQYDGDYIDLKKQYLELGFEVTPNYREHKYQLEFCSCRLTPTDLGWCLIPKAGRLLTKLGYSIKTDNPKIAKAIAVSAAKSMIEQCWAVPPLRAYFERVIELGKDVRSNIREQPDPDYKFGRAFSGETTPETWSMLDTVYGWTKEHQYAWEDWLNTIPRLGLEHENILFDLLCDRDTDAEGVIFSGNVDWLPAKQWVKDLSDENGEAKNPGPDYMWDGLPYFSPAFMVETSLGIKNLPWWQDDENGLHTPQMIQIANYVIILQVLKHVRIATFEMLFGLLYQRPRDVMITAKILLKDAMPEIVCLNDLYSDWEGDANLERYLNEFCSIELTHTPPPFEIDALTPYLIGEDGKSSFYDLVSRRILTESFQLDIVLTPVQSRVVTVQEDGKRVRNSWVRDLVKENGEAAQPGPGRRSILRNISGNARSQTPAKIKATVPLPKNSGKLKVNTVPTGKKLGEDGMPPNPVEATAIEAVKREEEKKSHKETKKERESISVEGSNSKALKEIIMDDKNEDRSANKWIRTINDPFGEPPICLGDTPFPTQTNTLYGRGQITQSNIIANADTCIIWLSPVINTTNIISGYDNAANVMIVAAAGSSTTATYATYANLSPMWGTAGSTLQSTQIYAGSRRLSAGLRLLVNSPETSARPVLYGGVVPDLGATGAVYKYYYNSDQNVPWWLNNPSTQMVEGNSIQVAWRPEDQDSLLFDDFWCAYPGDNSFSNADMPTCATPYAMVTGIVAGTIITFEFMSNYEVLPGIVGTATLPPNQFKNRTVCDSDAVFDKAINGLGSIAGGAVSSMVDFGVNALADIGESIFGGLFGLGKKKLTPSLHLKLKQQHSDVFNKVKGRTMRQQIIATPTSPVVTGISLSGNGNSASQEESDDDYEEVVVRRKKH